MTLALLPANSIAEMQTILEKVETAANSVDLHMNVGKTKYMAANLWGPDERIWVKSSIPVEKNPTFCVYLGSWIKCTESNIKVKKGKAWAACHQMPQALAHLDFEHKEVQKNQTFH